MRIEDNQGHTRGREGHDAGRPDVVSHTQPGHDADHPGYETQDVNVGGIVTFLAGLSGFLIVFFVFCWIMGKVINTEFLRQDAKDGRAVQWQANMSQPGAALKGEKHEDLASNAAMQQRQLAAVTRAFPKPVLEADDSNQSTADLHAREDLLLDFYSTSNDLQGGAIRIPIDRAMELIVQRGLGSPAAAAPKTLMAGEQKPVLSAPLTTGFARTGYELETIEARAQKLEYTKAEK